ncbi:MAG: ABC transporter permease [Candidatus Magasanikbacteria bacterium]|nr:ABC transporter permease [Candidatus Magasanikbacteria bacterium]
MNILENITDSYKILARSKARSFLTMLGIIIGIMAVIIVMSVGAGAQSLILNQVKSMGSNLVGVLPGASEEDGPPASAMGIVVTTLTSDDGDAILQDACPCIEAVSMYVSGNDTLSAEDASVNTTFTGVSATYTDVEDAVVEEGRFFSLDEERSSARLVVLGSEVKDKLFGDQHALGKRVKIKKSNFTVIGVMEQRGVSGFQNQDDQVFVPLRTAQKILLGINHVSFMRVKVDSADNIERAKESIVEVLRDRHDIGVGDTEDFSVRSMAQGLDALTSITNALKFFLIAVSSIALVVGGFGIMNIMLATVQERTREIGLRKAVGARARDIIFQFLTEASLITFLGGVIGIILGTFISLAVAQVAQAMGYDWDLVVTPFSIILGSVVSIGVGLVFGILPAKRASGLDPIEALRYE